MKNKIFNLYKKYILDIATIKYPSIKKRTYPLEYYLKNFIYVLNDVVKWESLRLLHKNESAFHWKTIYNEFVKWSNDNIFEEAFNFRYFKISKIKKNKKLNLFIDVTKITNKFGHENIGINCEYMKKNVTSLTIICDQNKLPLAVKSVDINKTIYNNRKTFKHEVTNIQETINKIPLTLKPV